MLIRTAQMAIAVLGMALVLRWGVTRDPGWGETSYVLPVIWSVHPGPLAAGIVCLLVMFGMMVLLNRD